MAGEKLGCSDEGASFLSDELMFIDWATQAAGFELMYEQTGDPDYQLMAAQARVKAQQQAVYFEEVARLERLVS